MPKKITAKGVTGSFQIPGNKRGKRSIGSMKGRSVVAVGAHKRGALAKRADARAQNLIKNIECGVGGGSGSKKVGFRSFTGDRKNTGAKGDDSFGPVESVCFIAPAKMLSDDNLLELSQRVTKASQKARSKNPTKGILKASSEPPLINREAMSLILEGDAAYEKELAYREELNSVCEPYRVIFLEAGGNEEIIKERLGKIPSDTLDEDDQKLSTFELNEKDETLKREISDIRMKVFMLRPDLEERPEQDS